MNLRVDSLIDRRQSWTAWHDRTSIHMKDDERLLGTESGGEHLSACTVRSAPSKRTHRKFLLSSSLNLYRVRFPWTAFFSQWGISLTIDAREFCQREWETRHRVLFARLGGTGRVSLRDWVIRAPALIGILMRIGRLRLRALKGSFFGFPSFRDCSTTWHERNRRISLDWLRN